MFASRLQSLLIAAGLAAGFASAGPVAAANAPGADGLKVALRSVTEHAVPAGLNADAKLLVHTMPDVQGRQTPATTLLFVPKGTAPNGGWPIVAWAHGTSTPGQKTCAPSLTPELDGGLTRDGFPSDYVYQIGELLKAGYAVVAPDLEGLGAEAIGPYPYFGAASGARSLISAVEAARLADPHLSNRYAAMGHSDGGHLALGVEAHADEAPELELVGTVASVPYTSIDATAEHFGQAARTATDGTAASQARMMREFQGALMTVGLTAENPAFNPRTVMGEDLARLLPAFRSLCSVKAIGTIDAAVKAKGEAFDGLKTDWASNPEMKAFLAANDPAAAPDFSLKRPTLVVQGTADGFVLEPLTTAFVERLRGKGAPVTYKTYPGADHFSIIRSADADVLAFLRERFAH
ncbi:alpha/beta hydrolase family protein [Mangrovicella endophytica]|uniref:alpha/beta hydrolase family protein n=1 Tax=Mangrovicella endophytica TaxID=2066697 RepID=UPI0012FFDE79|nr:alpha/beta fold hydrolase [Mangrovicella endophytica]